MDHVYKLLVFSAELGLIVIAVVVVMGFFFYFLGQSKRTKTVEIEHLNEKMRSFARLLRQQMLSKKELKAELKADKKHRKEEKKAHKPKIYVLDFLGDMRANAVDNLREEVTAILTVARPEDEVVLRLESAGGVVHGYGLAAAQLMRIKERGIKLTIAVDKIAASGGYMMACVADRILAAPFAIVGSIGVVAPVPNFNRLLRKHQIEYREYTAGDYKRTVSMLGENTPQGVAKFNEQLQDTHILFKDFIREHRPRVGIDEVATGEHWYGRQALALNLVDELKTSDAYLVNHLDTAEIYKITYFAKRKLAEKLADAVGQTAARMWVKFESEMMRFRYR